MGDIMGVDITEFREDCFVGLSFSPSMIGENQQLVTNEPVEFEE